MVPFIQALASGACPSLRRIDLALVSKLDCEKLALVFTCKSCPMLEMLDLAFYVDDDGHLFDAISNAGPLEQLTLLILDGSRRASSAQGQALGGSLSE